jgi:putative ABC transport system permease protein
MQFLSEALTLSILGGVIGYFLAMGLAAVIGVLPFLSELFEDKSRQGDIYLLINSNVFFISFATFTIIGLLSGTWPAIRASRLDPVEALRAE